jgi:tRNA U38,U39,U40 pseudouridine synthase TruA
LLKPFLQPAVAAALLQGVLFPVLRRVKLIPEEEEVASLAYSRCGRTDKGVSALGQVRQQEQHCQQLLGTFSCQRQTTEAIWYVSVRHWQMTAPALADDASAHPLGASCSPAN